MIKFVAFYDEFSSLCLRDCFIVEADVFCRDVFLLQRLCDDDISPFIDVLNDSDAVDDVELLMIDVYLLIIDYIVISTKVII